MKEISVSGMNLEQAKAGVERSLRSFSKGVRDCGNTLDCGRSGHGIVRGKGYGAGRDDVAPAPFLLGKFAPALPRTSGARFAAGVGELDARHAALGMYE